MKITRREFEQPRLPSHVDRLADWKAGRIFPPVRMNVSPAGGCNHRCRFCYTEYLGHPGILMDGDVLKKSCVEMARFGVRQIVFEGIGEPLLNPASIDALICAKEAGLPSAYLVTNGTLFTPDVFHPLLPHLTERDMIRISAPEATPELYAITHGCSAKQWHILHDNLVALKQERKPGQGCVIATVYPTPDVVGKVRAAVGMCIELGADIVSITPPIFNPANASVQDKFQQMDLGVMHKGELENIETMSTADCLVVVNGFMFGTVENRPEPDPCHGIDFYGMVGPDAQVYPCFRHWLNDEFSYGDLAHGSFEDIWNGARRMSVRAGLLNDGPFDCKLCCHRRMNRTLADLKTASRFSGAI